MRYAIFLLCLVTCNAFAQVRVEDPWTRATAPGAKVGAGYMKITSGTADRLKRMINASGFKVWPAEVEALLYGHPAIQEACVIGAPDGYRGETVKALVVLKKNTRGTKPIDITEWARAKMAAYKVPRVVEFVEQLPKTPTGKILWRELQEKERRK